MSIRWKCTRHKYFSPQQEFLHHAQKQSKVISKDSNEDSDWQGYSRTHTQQDKLHKSNNSHDSSITDDVHDETESSITDDVKHISAIYATFKNKTVLLNYDINLSK